jgi:signal transduction histidine kinase
MLLKHLKRFVTKIPGKTNMLQLQEANSLKAENHLLHDINNLLEILDGNLQLLQQESADKNINHSLDICEKATRKITVLIRRAFDKSADSPLQMEIISIPSLLRDIADFILKRGEISCEFDFFDNLKPVRGNSAELTRVFENILINSVYSMSEGGTIHICAENMEIKKDQTFPVDCGEYVKISVRDGGHGIEKANLAKILEPGFTTKTSGLGLGLAIVQGIVENHRGFLTVNSEVDKGTVFYIYLPACLTE